MAHGGGRPAIAADPAQPDELRLRADAGEPGSVRDRLAARAIAADHRLCGSGCGRRTGNARRGRLAYRPVVADRDRARYARAVAADPGDGAPKTPAGAAGPVSRSV